MPDSASIEPLLAAVTHWAQRRAEIVALALVGSWARGAARPDSDIDLMLLTPTPTLFRRDQQWMYEIAWLEAQPAQWDDAIYGVVWSRHLSLGDGTQVEFSFGDVSWAATEPLDQGTVRVVADGCRVLYDQQRHLARLVAAVRAEG